MAAFELTSADFDDKSHGYEPSAEDFAEVDLADSLRQNHPYLYKAAELLSKSPRANSFVEALSDNPIAEAGLSGGPALINAFGNAINMFNELRGKPKVVPKLESGFEEPKTLPGKIGSGIGSLVGSGAAQLLVPGGATLAGGAATGFAQGEGGLLSRGMDALSGLLIPGVLHGGKMIKSARNIKNETKNIASLELDKQINQEQVESAKQALANKLNKELRPLGKDEDKIVDALADVTPSSESVAKQAVANSLKEAGKSIGEKYNKLYSEFNESEAGQRLIKDPLKSTNINKEYGISHNAFSKRTKELMGSSGKVSDYIDLWKQIRDEASNLKQLARTATEHGLKNKYQNEAKSLSKLRDDIDSRITGTLTDAEKKAYQDIQSGYSQERIPFTHKPVLKSATSNLPNIPDDVHGALNSIGSPRLMETLKKEFPGVVAAITAHDVGNLMKVPGGIKNLPSKMIEHFTKGDFGDFINPEVKGGLSLLAENKKKQELLKSALKKIQTTETGRAVHANAIEDIIKQTPWLGKPFKDIETQQKAFRLVKDKLVHAGLSKQKLIEEMKKYKSAYSASKTAGIAAGLYGNAKKRSRSGDITDALQ